MIWCNAFLYSVNFFLAETAGKRVVSVSVVASVGVVIVFDPTTIFSNMNYLLHNPNHYFVGMAIVVVVDVVVVVVNIIRHFVVSMVVIIVHV